ncbi:Nucleoside diphosphate-linked moiety X motif 19, mitochondrial, partial [Rhizopus stolonifer]
LIIAAPIPLELLKHNQGSNYRILMVKRNAKSSFINAHVYPGGVVDSADNQWPQKEHLLTEKICAIRETFEESGLLLTQPTAQITQDWRTKVHENASEFQEMCTRYRLKPATDRLTPFANWITPVKEKKRYNTTFFLTVLDQYQTKEEHDHYLTDVMADGTETLLFDWLKPEEALHKFQQKKIILMPPQWYSLYLMSKIQDFKALGKVGEDIFRTREHQLIPILPQPNASDSEDYTGYLSYPGDESYGGEKDKRHRLYFKGRPMEEYKLDINISKL